MKLDIKKIAFIAAASIFAFSGVFAQDQIASDKTNDDQMHPNKFKNVKLINQKDADHEAVIVIEGAGKGNKEKLSGKEEKKEFKPTIRVVDITIKKKGFLGPVEKKDNLKIKIDGSWKREQIINKIKEEIQNNLKDRGLTVEADGDTLVFTLGKGNAAPEASPNAPLALPSGKAQY